jgi:hypothetical protein
MRRWLTGDCEEGERVRGKILRLMSCKSNKCNFWGLKLLQLMKGEAVFFEELCGLLNFSNIIPPHNF